MKVIPYLVFLIIASSVCAADVVIHKGRTYSTDGSLGASDQMGPSDQIQEVYYVSKTVMQQQKKIDIRKEALPLDMPAAIAAVRQSLSPPTESVIVTAVQLENYTWNAVSPSENSLEGVFYYTMELRISGELHKFVILMDGTVIEPKFR